MIVFELFVPNNGHNFKFAGNMQHIKYKNVVQCIQSAGVPIFKVYFSTRTYRVHHTVHNAVHSVNE